MAPEYHILVTGFEPFGTPRPKTNASWEAARLLSDQRIAVPNPADPGGAPQCLVHLHTLQLPVEYDAVLARVPPLYHQSSNLKGQTFDFIIHVGQTNPQQLTVEQCARRSGYTKKDNVEQVIAHHECPNSLLAHFGLPTQAMPSAFTPTIDVPKLVTWLQQRHQHDHSLLAQPATDAGLYLCEFTYYVSMCCSWAMSQQSTASTSAGDNACPLPPQQCSQRGPDLVASNTPLDCCPKAQQASRVLFIHVPPENQPLTAQQSSQVIRDTVVWLGQHYLGSQSIGPGKGC
ncbi:hypothetical protein H4R34_001271 [Dimargaris verticillata]|uniref:Peptidase C15, pyroglutamyl peptidase I-like protein n=1 Tax=Dimargaris verticillata TaxID=2761393 RepID=A0A9W8EEM3_9FUNG|nr:hypothetical protein H4R34_001271 [Dimargaris verticillata]